MRIVSIHDPNKTSLLSPSKHVRFIPSIAKWVENKTHVLYLVSYRVWKPESDPKRPVTKPDDPGHPWVTFWKMSRFDGTAFLLLEVSKRNPSNVRVLREFPVSRNGRVDMRLYPSPNRSNEFFVTFNTFGLLNPRTYPKNYGRSKETDFQPTCFLYKHPKTDKVFPDATAKPTVRVIDANKGLTVKHKEMYKQQSWCTFQMKAVMRYNETTGKFEFRETGLVCPAHHQRFEKNMQIFTDDQNRVGYQYALTPWNFFEPETCTVIAPHKTTLFSRLAKHFDARPDIEDMARNVAFSCSTPLIDYTNTEYLAVGHFKIHHGTHFGQKRNINTFLKQILKLLDMKNNKIEYEGYEDRIHPKLIYGMFFYTVDKKTLRLNKASGGFVPLYKDFKQALSFPTGLSQHTKDQFLVSYHENDMTMRLLSVSRKEIDQTLVFDNSSKVSEYTFELLF